MGTRWHFGRRICLGTTSWQEGTGESPLLRMQTVGILSAPSCQVPRRPKSHFFKLITFYLKNNIVFKKQQSLYMYTYPYPTFSFVYEDGFTHMYLFKCPYDLMIQHFS